MVFAKAFHVADQVLKLVDLLNRSIRHSDTFGKLPTDPWYIHFCIVSYLRVKRGLSRPTLGILSF